MAQSSREIIGSWHRSTIRSLLDQDRTSPARQLLKGTALPDWRLCARVRPGWLATYAGLLLTTLLIASPSTAQGLDVVTGSFGAFADGGRVDHTIHLGDRVEFNVTVKSLYADECNVSVGLEVESVGLGWQDDSLGRLVNGSAIVSFQRFSFFPNQTRNVILSWDTNGEVTLKSGAKARTQRAEYHLEFERDDCDGGGDGTALGLVLYSEPQNFAVVCPRDESEFLGACKTPTEVILISAAIFGAPILAAVGIAITIRRKRRGRPPIVNL